MYNNSKNISLTLVYLILISVNNIFAQENEILNGKFKPTWKSFEENYQCPDWFRDAKFGIWAHWTAQCVPEQGDWYARGMYEQGNKYYDFHVKKYGHPTKYGFMEIDNLWKAENWDPAKLMELYKYSGAKYFVALANHHDNFDNYNSEYHKWNSVNVGPKKDIVGIWEKIARKNGMYFGVSNHSAHAWHWFQTAYGYDQEGPLAGIRYDAATLTKEDGKGKWWEGLDPQELYTGPNIIMPDGINDIKTANDWHEKNDRVWTEEPPLQNKNFTNMWFLRCKDLVDKYKPDLVYFDDYELPLGQAGLDIVAHFYNSNIQLNNGKLEAVVTAKQLKPEQKSGIVEDIERGFSSEIQPFAWQTCSCIGNWHYRRSDYENNSYKTPKQIIHSLIDIVSKNGNLLLSIPIRGDGTIDDLEVKFLENLGKWMEINGEGIYGTRPWKVYGEGPTKVKAGMFNESDLEDFSNEDIRFTSKSDTLYAFMMNCSESKVANIKSLGKHSDLINGQKIEKIKLLGSENKLEWKQTNDSLIINLSDENPLESVAVVKIILGKY
ncbi:MAG: alpha-L-fucosidase [Ignavibacteriales bacterium]|nr:alpha-L-fucosidase [Ignavibacteriales bacterium]